MRPTHLRLVREDVVIPDMVGPRQAIERLTLGTHPGGRDFVFLSQEGEVLKRVLHGRMFRREHLDAIVQEILRLDRLEPDDDDFWDDERKLHAWWREQYRAYVERVRDGLARPQWLDAQLFALMAHRRDVERETGKPVRLQLLRAAVTAFIITPDPNRTNRLTG